MNKLNEFNGHLLQQLAIKYGKIATRKFIVSFDFEQMSSKFVSNEMELR